LTVLDISLFRIIKSPEVIPFVPALPELNMINIIPMIRAVAIPADTSIMLFVFFNSLFPLDLSVCQACLIHSLPPFLYFILFVFILPYCYEDLMKKCMQNKMPPAENPYFPTGDILNKFNSFI